MSANSAVHPDKTETPSASTNCSSKPCDTKRAQLMRDQPIDV